MSSYATSLNLPTFFEGDFGPPENNLRLQSLGFTETTADLKTAFEYLEREDMGT